MLKHFEPLCSMFFNINDMLTNCISRYLM